jgi:hypothetical protein
MIDQEFTEAFDNNPDKSIEVIANVAERVVRESLKVTPMWPTPIPVSEGTFEPREEYLFWFPGMCRLWTESGMDPLIAEPEDVRGDGPGHWMQMTYHSDGWLRRYGAQLKLSDAAYYLPLPPDPTPTGPDS